MSYIIVGDNILDSKGILNKIKEKNIFKEVKDLTKGSKREDTLIFQVVQDVTKLQINLDSELISSNKEEVIEELMSIADETAYNIEELVPNNVICYVYSYHYNEELNEIKTIIVAADKAIGGLRLRDIAERILRSVD